MNQKRYWLRGALGIGIPLAIIVIIATITDSYPFNLIGWPTSSLCQMMTGFQEEEMMACAFLYAPMIDLVLGLIIGAVAGFLYGKSMTADVLQ